MTSKTDYARLAMLYDGEGCFHICKQRQTKGIGFGYRLEMPIGMTSLRIMKWLVVHFGGAFQPLRKDPRYPNGKQMYRWIPLGGKKRQEKLLLGILPYLIEKAEQAKIALEFVRLDCKFHLQEREKLNLDLRVLKRESVETNTLESMIESDLISDSESAQSVMTVA